jgi:hypothetical protein
LTVAFIVVEAFQHPAHPNLSDQARISNVKQDSDFRTKSPRGKNRIFPPSLRASGARRETSQLHTSFTSSAKYLTSLNIMAYPKKTPAVQFHVDCTPEAKSRFATLHEAFGFKTKAATFEAVLFAVSVKDKIDPQILLRLETKLDRVLETSTTYEGGNDFRAQDDVAKQA